MKAKKFFAGAATLAIILPLAACGGSGDANGGGSEGDAGAVQWWTWDDKQAVSYQKCVAPFEAANPGVKVDVKQYAWDDYWTKITTGFVGGTAPDAFQNHINFYPEYADQGQLLALDDKIKESNFDIGAIATGKESWVYKDGKTYGLPMDWATTGFFYNAEMLKDAGLTVDDVNSMTWNPEDGGTFDDIVARLTIDENGVRGDEDGFNKDKVAVYGTGTIGTNGLNGQDSWGFFLSTTGWTLGDKDNWPTKFNFDDPTFMKSMNYFRGLADRGLSPREGDFTQGAVEQLGSKKVAMTVGGSWYATTFFALPDIEVGIAPSVANDKGERSSLTNSNGNSIWAGSPRVDNTWKWVSYMGSEECQSMAGVDGTFFPSIPASMKVTQDAMMEQGIDISPYVKQFEEGTLYTTPMFPKGQEIGALVNPLMEMFFAGERNDDAFTEMVEVTTPLLEQ